MFDRPLVFFQPQPQRRRPPGPRRKRLDIAVVGDSFTVGEGVQWDDAYPARLERLLNLNADVPPAHVTVLAESGTSTVTQIGRVRRALARRPDLLLLGVFLNDTEDHRSGDLDRLREGILPQVPSGWRLAVLRRSALLRWAYHRYEGVRAWHQVQRYYRELYDPEYSGWQKFTGALAEISELAERRGVPLRAVVVPAMVSLDPDRYLFREQHRKIAGALEEAGIPALDLLDDFLGTSDLRVAAWPEIDGHPSEIGHRIAAEAIFRYLLDTGSIPAGYRPAAGILIERRSSLYKARRMKTPVAIADQPRPRQDD